ncbi:MAG TPA: L-threonate dehydrogenase [Afifellaceae bacterium]|nr:L-threonate dehydrogenase [Afifellaceae bacterium]
MTSSQQPVAVIGLGNMGFGSAASLLKAGIAVHGCDLGAQPRARIEAEGGKAFEKAGEAAAGCRAAFLFVVNQAQTEAVLFGEGGVIGALPPGGVVVNCVTVPPDFAEDVAGRVIDAGFGYLDAPVSGGAVGAASGQMTVMGSGAPESFDAMADCFDAIARTVYRMSDAPGDGSRMKMVNQLLAGVHIVSACEALTLGIKSGLDPKVVYDVICKSAGNSWMWGDRMPHVLDNDYTPKSAVDIFVKDLGIVLEAGQNLNFPLPVASAARQMFMVASGAGFGAEDDSAVAKIYAANSNTRLPDGDQR